MTSVLASSGAQFAVPDVRGSAAAVLGLGPRGLAAARALEAGGARVLAWDDSADAREAALAQGLEVVDLRERDWGDLALLVVTPQAGPPAAGEASAVARTRDLALLTRTPVVNDLELFARGLAAQPSAQRGRLVLVSGTRGKSSATAIIGWILKSAGRDAQASVDAGDDGAPGKPVLALAPPHAGSIYIVEAKLADLSLAPSLAPRIAVLLNAEDAEGVRPPEEGISPWARVFAGQGATDHAVIGVDDAVGREVATEIGARDAGPTPVPVSVGRALGRGVHAVGGVLFDAIDGRAAEIVDLRRAPALIGRGGWQNAAAAYAVCRLLGLEPGKIAELILAFRGLPHRLEVVGRRGAVRFVNDSEAADPGAARHGLAAFENVYWVAGGRRTEEGFAGLAPLMPRVAKAYLIGEAAEALAAQLKGRVVVEIARDLKTAVEHAAADAQASKRADPVVLLSPACGAGDQFASEAARGEAFRALVAELPGSPMSGEAA